MWKPQILASIICISVIALAVIFAAPEYIEVIVGGAVTGIGMLGMKLLEK
uniref:Uncharacterized protein n=1 Tax=viral metagenome TaxID=1070528 RepID=A0A6M3K6M7_9ZZZZ